MIDLGTHLLSLAKLAIEKQKKKICQKKSRM